jgi:epoxyqueuosine reductase QueG
VEGRNATMNAEYVKRFVREEILRRGFNGSCGIASFSDVYYDLMPVQRRELEKIYGDGIHLLLNEGSVISIAVFHTENAIESINTIKDGRVDCKRWNIYADEYNVVNNVLNDVCDGLVSVLFGVPFKATVEGKKVRSVEEYYPLAKISHRVVAEHAGMGARGKNELIVTKQNGSAVRFTSFIIQQGLERDKEVKDLCGNCRVCLDSCRILQGKEQLRNYRQQCMQKITALSLHYPVCGICVKACYEKGNWRKKFSSQI